MLSDVGGRAAVTMVWYGMVWYGMIWYGVVLMLYYDAYKCTSIFNICFLPLDTTMQYNKIQHDIVNYSTYISSNNNIMQQLAVHVLSLVAIGFEILFGRHLLLGNFRHKQTGRKRREGGVGTVVVERS